MKRLLIASAAAAVLSGCETSPGPYRQVVVAPPAPVIDNPLTHAAEREAMAKFGGTGLKPGDYRILPAAAIPAKGEVNVLVSLRNLQTFPFVRRALEAGTLTLHGWYFDLQAGALLAYSQRADAFLPLVCPLAITAAQTESVTT